MAKAITILNRVFPFSYLTDAEKAKLVNNSLQVVYPKGSILCQAGSSSDLNLLFILLTGRVSVILDPGLSGTIKAPSYFGERSLFFFQPRKATIQVETKAECLVVDRKIILELIHDNLSFCYGFATSLRNKHKIFDQYDDFVNLLKRKKGNRLHTSRSHNPYKLLFNPYAKQAIKLLPCDILVNLPVADNVDAIVEELAADNERLRDVTWSSKFVQPS